MTETEIETGVALDTEMVGLETHVGEGTMTLHLDSDLTWGPMALPPVTRPYLVDSKAPLPLVALHIQAPILVAYCWTHPVNHNIQVPVEGMVLDPGGLPPQEAAMVVPNPSMIWDMAEVLLLNQDLLEGIVMAPHPPEEATLLLVSVKVSLIVFFFTWKGYWGAESFGNQIFILPRYLLHLAVVQYVLFTVATSSVTRCKLHSSGILAW